MDASFDTGFLRATPLFRHLDAESLVAIHTIGELMECPPGTVLIHAGSPPEDLYVVRRGMLEVRSADGRLLAFAFEGETVGEMSILTRSPRSATVRVPEYAEVLRLPGDVFERLLGADARIALAVARSLALRLQKANAAAPEPLLGDDAQHLGGDLRYFDLVEVVQTILGARRSGEMRLSLPAIGGDVYVSFDDGRLVAARVGRVSGRAAVLYLLRRKLEGRFEFRARVGIVDPADAVDEDSPLTLLLEAAQQRDELEAILARLPGREATLVRAHVPFPYDDALSPAPEEERRARGLRGAWAPASEDERALARRVWAVLDTPTTLGALLDRAPADELPVAEIVLALVSRRALAAR